MSLYICLLLLFCNSDVCIWLYLHEYGHHDCDECVCVNVCAGFRQITLIKDTDDTVLLMIVCPFV